MTTTQDNLNVIQMAFMPPTGVTEGTPEGDDFEAACRADAEAELKLMRAHIDTLENPASYKKPYMSYGSWMLWKLGVLYIMVATPWGPFIPAGWR